MIVTAGRETNATPINDIIAINIFPAKVCGT